MCIEQFNWFLFFVCYSQLYSPRTKGKKIKRREHGERDEGAHTGTRATLDRTVGF